MNQSGTKASIGSLHGFTVALTSFIGRSGEVTEVTDLLREYRMVTVTGPGGMGKTRLADKAARELAADFADGVWLAELASVGDPELTAAQVAAVLGVQVSGQVSGPDAIAEMIAGRQLLLVLDNCEHVLAPVARLCTAILGAADDVRILATSREPVGVPGEARYRLRPMSLPAETGTEGVPESDAVILFADRARRADARFAVSAGNLPEVASLVRRLDGMPLAIELAAARVEALGLALLAHGLDDRFRLLESTSRTGPGRQQSLAATADWSYRLLAADEQRAFRALASFPGGFTLDAARAVAGPDVANAVLHLVDCSMIAPPQQGADGRARYTMLAALRAYGQAKLAEAGESDQAARAMAAFAVSVAEQASPVLATAEEASALRWLDAEAACLRQATAWSLRSDQATALRLAIALSSWWQRRGHHRLGFDVLSQVADVPPPGSGQWRAARLWLGTLANVGLGPKKGLAHLSELIAACDDIEPDPVLARALCTQSGALANLGRLDEAASLAHRALDLARSLDDAYCQALALYWLSGISHYRGDQAESLRWARQLNSVDQERVPRRAWIRGLMGQVIPLFESAEYAEARRLSQTALELSRAIDDSDLESEALFHLARIELEAGRAEAARARLSQALISGKRVMRPIGLLDLLDVCGHYFARTGAPAAALTIWAAHATSLRADQISDPVEDARRRRGPRVKARTELGETAATVAEDRGAAMTLPVAAEFALLSLGAGEQPEPARPAGSKPSGTGPRGTGPRGTPFGPGDTGLSPREQELVVLVARGLTDAQIAGQLIISVSTVRSHLDRIRDKTGCRRRADLTRLALQAGLA